MAALTREFQIKMQIQALITEYGLTYADICDLNDDYDFIYAGEDDGDDCSDDDDDEDFSDYCSNCGEHYDDCTCGDCDGCGNHCDACTCDEDQIILTKADADDMAADEFAQHEFNQFKKKNNPGGGNNPQQGL